MLLFCSAVLWHVHKCNLWLGPEMVMYTYSCFSVSSWGKHVPVLVLSSPDQILGHGQHAMWQSSSGVPEADREDHEGRVWAKSGPPRPATEQTASLSRNRHSFGKKWQGGKPILQNQWWFFFFFYGTCAIPVTRCGFLTTALCLKRMMQSFLDGLGFQQWLLWNKQHLDEGVALQRTEPPRAVRGGKKTIHKVYT